MQIVCMHVLCHEKDADVVLQCRKEPEKGKKRELGTCNATPSKRVYACVCVQLVSNTCGVVVLRSFRVAACPASSGSHHVFRACHRAQRRNVPHAMYGKFSER